MWKESGTAALREAAAAMRSEVERMEAARETTQQVSELIGGAVGQSRELQGGLATGRGLISRLERRDFTDRLVIGFAFAIFVVVCGYILKVLFLFVCFAVFFFSLLCFV